MILSIYRKQGRLSCVHADVYFKPNLPSESFTFLSNTFLLKEIRLFRYTLIMKNKIIFKEKNFRNGFDASYLTYWRL